jgi:MFS family permease
VLALLRQLKFSKELNFLFLSIFLFAGAMGINFVTFPTILNQHNLDAAHVGIAFTTEIVGGLFMSFFLSRLVNYLGMVKVLRIASFTYAASILLIYFYQGFYLWIGFAFIMGNCWFAYVITRQAWLNILLNTENRGVGLGFFSLVISIGIASGPIIVSYLGASSYLSFLASSTLVIASFFCLKILIKNPLPKISSQRIPLLEFFKKNPRCFLGRFFLDFQTYLLMTFTVIFGVRIGLSYEAAGLLITAYLASGFFDVVVGFLLKKYNSYKIINIGFLGCITSFLMVILYHESYIFLLIIYFIFGFFIACIYVSLFKVCNDDYPPKKLVAANSTFQIIGSSGSIFGSLIGGYLVYIFGTQGFPITMVLSCVLYLSFLVFYDKNKK